MVTGLLGTIHLRLNLPSGGCTESEGIRIGIGICLGWGI